MIISKGMRVTMRSMPLAGMTQPTVAAVMIFGGGDDTLYGDAGDDTIEGNTGDDNLFGGLGADNIAGGGGLDVLNGGAGNDTLSSDRLDSSADFSRGVGETLIGAEGEDTIIFSNADQVSGGA
jgi:Ca2+-binding RTX toxin-like protein